ncbi:hypothetical protein CLAFUW4_01852 [Fulvia fulva]|uniref:WD40 repeat-like protein n=1 Tax=Passalora fulva TaxID=5499 RepID=A0A9Q8P291_PASFU|nr:uncharacterized protein CLAFUR5_01847 [Fulvia fulva]KAK4634585.1 hypothetical protein CLAFUR4_01847 [Fulvia fulva]KAK4638047.1 hypothetical protein CLAFUR0_01849 [Fulvia fulva]UJO10740.1 hypothetical protein CLAFUR5_01847 [Fulvia fulva]WPV08774.1 hypothetical protein CLAFUW4_01852 [Fulvia fulva]WPV24100.1 hypothetical protein CLAFUW7_01851 [Fulvia fulva]
MSLESSRTADPFGPTPARTARMAERYATLRRFPFGAGPPSRAATLVPDARPGSPRAISAGAVWSVGGTIVTEGVASVTDRRGGRVTSGTSAPHYTAGFLHRQTPSEDEVQHSERLAVAMDIERNARMFTTPPSPSASSFSTPRRSHSSSGRSSTYWSNNSWQTDTPPSSPRSSRRKIKDVPAIPFRVLDAPQLRDDFYCSLLAYSHTMQCLAVGLGQHVYLWSENRGTTPTHIPDSLTAPFGAHVTSLSFSSAAGASAILAIGRANGQITLWSPLDFNPRFSSDQPAPVSCVCLRPNPVKRPSVRKPGVMVNTEELLVGDEAGHVYYYSIEWPTQSEVDLFDWQGSMSLLARLECHTQQICSMAWSGDGEYFATGGNDNQMFLYESKRLLRTQGSGTAVATVTVRNGTPGGPTPLVQNGVRAIMPGQEKHLFTLNAAVKAIAFAPWQSSLIAAGGGSNDRCIHFFHAMSGATLATIDCYAQVTSLVWSERKQEIAVTFGFAQPEHPYRVAVFAWPSCRRVVSIPWWGEERALSAVAYPGGPHGGPGQPRHAGDRSIPMSGQARRTREEGCLVVATSDASIKFHEIWPDRSEQGRDKVDRAALGSGSIPEDNLSPTLMRGAAIR